MASEYQVPEVRLHEMLIGAVHSKQLNNRIDHHPPQHGTIQYQSNGFRLADKYYATIVICNDDGALAASSTIIPGLSPTTSTPRFSVKMSTVTSSCELFPCLRVRILLWPGDPTTSQPPSERLFEFLIRESLDDISCRTIKQGEDLPDNFANVHGLREYRGQETTTIVTVKLHGGKTPNYTLPGRAEFGSFQSNMNVLRERLNNGGTLHFVAKDYPDLQSVVQEMRRDIEACEGGKAADRYLEATELTRSITHESIKLRETVCADNHEPVFCSWPIQSIYHFSREALIAEMTGLVRNQEMVRTLDGYHGCRVRLVERKESPDKREMLCLFEKRAGDKIKVMPGHKVLMRFPQWNNGKAPEWHWEGNIEPFSGDGHVVNVAIHVRQRQRNGRWLGGNPSSLEGVIDADEYAAYKTRDELHILISRARVCLVDIKPAAGENGFETKANIVTRLENIMQQQESSTIDCLLTGRYDRLPRRDCIAALGLHSDDLGLMRSSFDAKQMELIPALQQAPAGLAVIHGPAGTGKTFTACSALLSLIHSQKRKAAQSGNTTRTGAQALFVGSSDADIEKALRDMINTAGQVVDDALFVRVSQHEVPHNIMKRLSLTYCSSKQIGSHRDQHSAHTLIDGISRYSPQEWIVRACCGNATSQDYAALSLHRLSQAIDAKTRQTIRDGFNMLTTATAAKGNLSQHCKREHWAACNLSELIKEARPALEKITDATFGTPHQVSQGESRDFCHPALIIVDGAEAIAAAESQVAQTFTSAKCTIYTGDLDLAGPRRTSSPEWNDFSLQAHHSWLARLVTTGFPVLRLTVEHRCNASLTKFVNKLAYKTYEFTTHGDVEFDPVIRKTWPRLPVSEERANAAIVLVQYCYFQGSTRLDQQNVHEKTLLGTLGELRAAGYDDSDIGIITPKSVQDVSATLSKDARRRGTLQGITCRPMELCHDLERNIIILFIPPKPPTDDIGSLGNMGWLLDAVTRARQAVVIIADVAKIEQTWPSSRLYSLLQEAKKFGVRKVSE